MELGGKFEKQSRDGIFSHFTSHHSVNVTAHVDACMHPSINATDVLLLGNTKPHEHSFTVVVMRFAISSVATIILLQLSSLSSSDAFSSAALSRVAKTSSLPWRKNDILYARLDNNDGEKGLIDSSNSNESRRMISSILLAGAALQFSTVSALLQHVRQ